MIINTPTPRHLLTLREYAAEIKAALPPLVEKHTKILSDAEAELDAWYAANPEPVRPTSYHISAKKFEEWKDAAQNHRWRWGSEYDKTRYASMDLTMVSKTLPLMAEAYIATKDGKYPHFNFVANGGVNNPLFCHGMAVQRALEQGLEVPDKVKAEYPLIVQAVLENKERDSHSAANEG